MSFDQDCFLYDEFSPRDYSREAWELTQKWPDAHKILEIGAGTGSLTRELQARGYDVTPVEPSIGMRHHFHGTTEKLYCGTIQQYFEEMKPEWNEFDLAIANYDVLNFIPDTDIDNVLRNMIRCSRACNIEVWPRGVSVRLFRYRKSEKGNRRFRFAFRWRNKVHLWFLYWHKLGFFKSKHTIYLHDMKKHGQAKNLAIHPS